MYGSRRRSRRRCRTTWGPEIELDAEDVGSDGTPEAAG
jgi:hypothetical protein